MDQVGERAQTQCTATSSMQMNTANKINFRTRKKTMMVCPAALWKELISVLNCFGTLPIAFHSTRISQWHRTNSKFRTDHFGSTLSMVTGQNASGAQDAHRAIKRHPILQYTTNFLAKYLVKGSAQTLYPALESFVAVND